MFKVHYYGCYGSAESIRMLLSHAKLPFENVDYTPEIFAEAKKGEIFEFKQAPVLEFEGKHYSQSHAILRLLGRKFNYYPTDIHQAYLVDSLLDSVKDVGTAYSKATWSQNEDEKKTLLAAFYETTFPNWCTVIEKRLNENSSQKHIVGDTQTIADFALATVGHSIVYNEANPGREPLQAVISRFPTLVSYFEAQKEENKERLTTRKPSSW